MKTKREYININHAIGNGIHQTVLFIDASAPLATKRAAQRPGLAYTYERMLQNVGKQGTYASHYFLVADTLPVGTDPVSVRPMPPVSVRPTVYLLETRAYTAIYRPTI